MYRDTSSVLETSNFSCSKMHDNIQQTNWTICRWTPSQFWDLWILYNSKQYIYIYINTVDSRKSVSLKSAKAWNLHIIVDQQYR